MKCGKSGCEKEASSKMLADYIVNRTHKTIIPITYIYLCQEHILKEAPNMTKQISEQLEM